ncbi:MAG: C-GCAxxG-C-C family protein [Akkermansia sp.]|nr:C-GCAxxG-C-C family protein [Akkermansia sp.]
MPQENAIIYFHRGYNCAQSVFAAFAGEMGLSEDAALRLPAAFGAGLGRMRGTCGAFSGLALIAGFKHGNLSPDPADKERIFALTRKLADDFCAEFGSLQCRELLHLPPDAEEGARPSERTAAYYASRPCERCVAFCAAKAAEILGKD